MFDWLDELLGGGNATLDVILQVVDFLWKAIVAYAKTPEGQKEFEDIARAVEAAQKSSTPTAARPVNSVPTASGQPTKAEARAAAGVKS